MLNLIEVLLIFFTFKLLSTSKIIFLPYEPSYLSYETFWNVMRNPEVLFVCRLLIASKVSWIFPLTQQHLVWFFLRQMMLFLFSHNFFLHLFVFRYLLTFALKKFRWMHWLAKNVTNKWQNQDFYLQIQEGKHYIYFFWLTKYKIFVVFKFVTKFFKKLWVKIIPFKKISAAQQLGFTSKKIHPWLQK